MNNKHPYHILSELTELIEERATNSNSKSYTSSLLQQGVDRIGKKIVEEAGEVLIAAKNGDPVELSNESADLIFHLLLLLKNQGISLKEVCDILQKRRHLK